MRARKPNDRKTNERRPQPRRRRPKSPPRTSQVHDDGADRLQKILAAAGIASRRECEEWITAGRIQVDGKVVTELGTRVDPRKQEIRVDGEPLPRPKLVYFAVNKPEGVVCTARDPAGRPRVVDMLPPDTPRAFCVGRLDMSSQGLILVTNDGELANGLTHPRHGVEKVYEVQVAGQVDQASLQKMRHGLHLAEGFAHVKYVKAKRSHKQSTILKMVLDEGRNREIRRLLARVGHKVQRLTRIAVGPVRLADLPSGAVRPLTRQEVSALREAIAHGRQPKPNPKPDRSSTTDTSAKKIGGKESQRPKERKRSIIGG